MKKGLIFKSVAFAFCACVFAACSTNDNASDPVNPPVYDDTPSELEEYYFTIQHAIYRDAEFPQATIDEYIDGLSVNSNALRGGMNIISVTTDKVYNKFFVGVKEIFGYWELTPIGEDEITEEETAIEVEGGYQIPVMYSTLFDQNITMMIAAEDENGEITKAYEVEINVLDTQSQAGDLEVNLVFSNAKDVDLHLYTPSGQHIYYGNRGGEVETENGEVVRYGLDIDSNAGCSIDNINNENIYIPEVLIEDGTYRVVVNMWSNCDPSTSTSWSVVARYKNELIDNEIGTNPVTGIYPVGAGNSDFTEAMVFTIHTVSGVRSINMLPGIRFNTFKSIPLSDIDEMKVEESAWMAAQQKK